MAEPIKLNTEGLLLNWLKDVGDAVSAGDIIAEIEADKATVEIEAPSDGVLLELSAAPGDELEEGAVIGMIGAEGEAPAPGTDEAQTGTSTAEKEEQAQPTASTNGGSQQVKDHREGRTDTSVDEQAPTPAGTKDTESQNGAAARTPDGRIKISPVARRMAEDKGIDISTVTGSGPGGRIVKADIENYSPPAQQPAPSREGAPVAAQLPAMPVRKVPEGPDVEIMDVSRMRQRIATNTIESKQQIPHFYVTTEIDVEPMLALRKQINADLEADGIKVSVNDMIVKAAAVTLRQFPNLNTHYYGDKLVHHQRINIGIAVALDNGGLINVVAKDADTMPLSELSERNKAMIARAREGRVKPEDVQGSTFTTSNLGPFGVDHFAAIINPPEAGIIAVGTAKKVPVVMEDGTLGVGNRMKVTISVDHRVSDGAEGAAYLQQFRNVLENPMRMLL